MATISKDTRTGKYRVQIRNKGFRPISRTFDKKRDATRWARRVESDRQLMKAEGSHAAVMTLAELIDEYTAQWTGRDKSSVTRMAWWKENYGHLLINEISKHQINEALRCLESGMYRRGLGKKKPRQTEKGKRRSPATVNRYKAALSGVFSYAVREYDLPENPVRKARTYANSQGRTRFLSDDERKALLDACKQSEWPKLHALILLALTTGARRGELTGLRWTDIDFKRRTATIHRTKNGQPRVLPLTQAVITELMPFREVGTGLVFDGFTFEKHWQKALKAAEIADFRFHDLRHSAASYLAMNGASLLEIADILGHQQLEVTKRYSHLCITHKATLINKIMGDL